MWLATIHSWRLFPSFSLLSIRPKVICQDMSGAVKCPLPVWPFVDNGRILWYPKRKLL